MKQILLIIFFQFFFSSVFSDILVFKNCSSKDYEFEKNEYKLDLKKGVMTREFIYSDDTYNKLRMNDLRIEKKTHLQKELQKKTEK